VNSDKLVELSEEYIEWFYDHPHEMMNCIGPAHYMRSSVFI
jgi:hypothetical protein